MAAPVVVTPCIDHPRLGLESRSAPGAAKPTTRAVEPPSSAPCGSPGLRRPRGERTKKDGPSLATGPAWKAHGTCAQEETRKQKNLKTQITQEQKFTSLKLTHSQTHTLKELALFIGAARADLSAICSATPKKSAAAPHRGALQCTAASALGCLATAEVAPILIEPAALPLPARAGGLHRPHT